MVKCKAVLVLLFLELVSSVIVNNIRVQNDVLPVKGKEIVLVCSLSNFDAVVYIYKTAQPFTATADNIHDTCLCNVNKCLSSIARYTCANDNRGIYISFLPLNRSLDQAYWTCFTDDGQKKSINLTVYTLPQAISYTVKPSVQTDLSQTSLILKASTDCIYPVGDPAFTWYTTEPGGIPQSYPVKGVTSSSSNDCSDKNEMIYTSTLTMVGNTTFTNNDDKTVQFQCGIDNTSLYTTLSERVVFAVKVTSVILLNGNTPIAVNNSIVTVANGTYGSLSCQPSFSRPNATVVWYIGQNEVKRGIDQNYNLHFNDSDHNKPIYCKAFNVQNINQAVESNRLILDVTVVVSSVVLRESISTPSSGSIITITSGAPKTLFCVLGTNRPEATVRWYIDNVQQQISDTKFQFTPDDTYHSKQIFCTAFNLQPESQAVTSNKSTLYVKVNAATPSLLIYGNAGNEALLENETVSLVCNTSLTRPAANIKWTGINVLNVKNSTNQVGRDLVWATSTAAYVPTRSDNNKTIVCETMIDGQETKASKQQNLEIWWPPFQPFVTELPTFPWTEGFTDRSLTCTGIGGGNPEVTMISWNSSSGIQDPNNASRLIVNTVTYEHDEAVVFCQLDNGYTLRKANPIKSDVKKFNINFSPKVLTENNNTIFASKSGAMFNESVPIYSKPKDIGNINIKRPDKKINRLNVTMMPSSITVHIQGTSVQRDGHIAQLFINDVTNEDFGNYSLDVSNSIGTLQWHFVVQALSKPFPVKVVKYLSIINEVPTFYMESGFNGGYQQEFSVETSVDGNLWTERLRFTESDSRFLQPNKTFIFGLNGLESGSYKVRVVARNTLGIAEQLEQSYVESITIVNKDQQCKSSSNHTEAIITGVVSSVVVCVLSVFITFLMTKRYRMTTKEDKIHVYEGMKTKQDVINLYDTLEQEREKHNVYVNTEVTTT